MQSPRALWQKHTGSHKNSHCTVTGVHAPQLSLGRSDWTSMSMIIMDSDLTPTQLKSRLAAPPGAQGS